MATLNQPTAGPARKVAAGGMAAAAVSIVVWSAGYFGHIAIPPEVAAALVTLASFAVAYFVPANADDVGG